LSTPPYCPAGAPSIFVKDFNASTAVAAHPSPRLGRER
jgi:hypothetical protein